MNLMTVDLIPECARLGNVTVPLPQELISAANHANLKRVTIGLRPECFSIEGGGGAGLKLEVSLVEEIGADAYLYGRLAGDEAKERLFTLRIAGRVSISIGETVTLAVRSDSPHVFHPETGDRIL